ncbi:hypothetical protein HYD86_02480 [Mycoplasmopsis bovis]|nr:hypothetical protein [Mycoplasmopsis bovis]QQH36897.1 hypothetical protein HYD86_02480 [Mycoplasmopsis bovis]
MQWLINVKKVSDGHISLALDHFGNNSEKTKVKLDIKKYGHKFNITGTNEFEFDVKKYETPKAKLICFKWQINKINWCLLLGIEYQK